MVKSKKAEFVCTECGSNQRRWFGRCPECSAYDTLKEFRPAKVPAGQAVAAYSGAATTTLALKDVRAQSAHPRFQTAFSEVDRVLGGGIVNNSVILLSGSPGAGKSTLLLQLLPEIAKSRAVLYATGEEALDQIRLRAERLKLELANIHVTSEINITGLLEAAEELKSKLIVVDSIQTAFIETNTAALGSTAQIRDCTAALSRYAKTMQICVLIIGHVTKDGTVAGPQVLAHIVDVVAHIDEISGSRYRQLRTSKNRYGSADEAAVFELTANGFTEICDPSSLFISVKTPQPGIAVAVVADHTQPILAEIQALVTKSFSEYTSRSVVGMDRNRVKMLIAVLQKHLRLKLYSDDIFINVSSGLRIVDPSSDLAVAAAVLSSQADKPWPAETAFIGEISLSGGIRPVPNLEARVRIAKRNGFKNVYVAKDAGLHGTRSLASLRDLQAVFHD